MATQTEELVRDLVKRGVQVGVTRSEGKLVLMYHFPGPLATDEECRILEANIEEVERVIDAMKRGL